MLQTLPGPTVHGENGILEPKSSWEGTLYLFLGEWEKAVAAYENARVFVEERLGKAPNDPNLHARLGMIYALLGRRHDAIREGKRAVQILPEEKDAYEGPTCTIGLAQIYAWTGENDQALAVLEKSLQTPNGITAAMLKIDPVYDPLRSDPRFQTLIDKYAAKT